MHAFDLLIIVLLISQWSKVPNASRMVKVLVVDVVEAVVIGETEHGLLQTLAELTSTPPPLL
jgi:hypothetical protein